MRIRIVLTHVIIGAALAATAVPARAAVTLRGLAVDDNPRSAWFDRYSEQRQGPEQVEKFTRSVKVGDGAVLDLSHLAGDVLVTGGGGSEIKIDATKRVRHRDADEAKRLLEALRIEVNTFNNRVEVRTIYPRRTSTRGNSISANVDYVIEVPSGIAVALKSVSGDLTCRTCAVKCGSKRSAATSASPIRRTWRSRRRCPVT